MEAPIEILIYLPLLSAFFVALKCLILHERNARRFVYNLSLYSVENGDELSHHTMVHPLRSFFRLRQRKIPVKETPFVSDEEGSHLLVFS